MRKVDTRFRTLLLLLLLLTGFGAGTLYRELTWREEGGDRVALAAPAAKTTAPEPGIADPNIFVRLAKRVVPSVVNISTFSRVSSPLARGNPDDLFRRFFEDFFRRHGGRGLPPGDEDEEEEMPPPRRGQNGPRALALGTGFIIDASGLILTNNHVVAEADEIKIYFTEEADEKPTDGEVVGRDPDLDMALIRVKTKRTLVPLPLGDSDALEVGEYVMAVGNPFGQGHTVTHGIISAKGREAPDFILANYIQTDAPINPGNSGGPLLNLRGEVVGVNNAIEARAQGIGFAIPSNQVKAVLPQLKTKGTVSRGYIGVRIEELTPEVAENLKFPKDRTAAFVTHVYPGEPADRAGVKPYDIITAFNGKRIASGRDLVREVTAVPIHESVPLQVWRNGSEKKLTVKISARPGGAAEAGPAPRPKPTVSPDVNLGMEVQTLDAATARDLGVPENTRGAVVTGTEYGGPADEAGLLRGDIILEIDRKPIASAEELFRQLKGGRSYLLRVRRADPQGGENYSVLVLDLKRGR